VRCRPAYYDDLGVYDADSPDPAEVVVDVPVERDERDAAFMTLARCEDRRARLRLRR
jgi:hypothetical protein